MGELIRVSMKQQIYEIVKGRIMDQTYPLGSPVNIVSLSKEFGVSNTPIREALNILCAEGLLVSTLNTKFRVIELNEDVKRELNEAVYVMLSGAYQCACRSGKATALPRLLEDAYAAQLACGKEADTEYIKNAIAFDRCFVQAAENEKLLTVFDNLSTLLFLSVRYTYYQSDHSVADNLSDHRTMLEAVRAGDQSRVLDTLLHHYSKIHPNEQ